MIGGVLEVIRVQVLAPQAGVPVPDERLYLDPDNVPLGVQPATAEVVGLSSTPINPEIGSGFGGVAGGTITMRHLAALILTVEGADRKYPAELRDRMVTSLLRRALLVDWVNAFVAPDQEVVDCKVTVEYADLETEQLAAYATLVFTVDTEWTV